MCHTFLFFVAVVKDFVLIGQHTCPRNAMKEIDQLYAVFKGIHKKWKTDVGSTVLTHSGHLSHGGFTFWRETVNSSDPPDSPFCFAQNVMILGDLNAACSYVTIKGWRAVRLRSDPKFQWLIGDEQDTTVREKTHCAYDRSEPSTITPHLHSL